MSIVLGLLHLPTLRSIFAGALHFVTGRYAWWFGTCLVVILLFLTRRATLAYLWRSFHLIEDLVMEKEFLRKIDLPIKILLLTILVCPSVQYIPDPYQAYFARFAAFLIPLLFVHVVVQACDLIVFRWYFEKYKESNPPAVFRAIAIGFVYAVVVLVLLEYAFGVNVIPVIATSTVATAVLGLALQDTLKNLFAGLTMSFEKRFHHGDWVSLKLDPATVTTGMISEIGWRTIRLKTLDDNFVVVPNATFTTANVTNFSRPTSSYVRSIEFPVGPWLPAGEVADALCREAASVEGVRPEPGPQATAVSVKLDQVVIRLRFWIDDFAQGDEISGKVIIACLAQLKMIGDVAAPVSAATNAPVAVQAVPAALSGAESAHAQTDTDLSNAVPIKSMVEQDKHC